LFHLELKTDDYPWETSWRIKDENGDILFGKGEYKEELTIFNYEYCLPVGCYDFVIDDSYGDGISYGDEYYDENGYYKGSVYGHKEVFDGGIFQFNANERFCGEDVCA